MDRQHIINLLREAVESWMNKLRAIWRIIRSEHFYLITADKKLTCDNMKSKGSDDYTISGLIQYYWNTYWKRIAHQY